MEEKPVRWKKKPAHCFESSRFGGYLLRFHLASDWSRNNKKIPEIFSGVHSFTAKTVSEI